MTGDFRVGGNSDLEGEVEVQEHITFIGLATPATSTGRVYRNVSDNHLYYYNSSDWVQLDGGGGTPGTIADNDATPDISGANIMTYNGTANSVTITDLDNPVVGSIITIIGNSDTFTVTINDSGNFNLSATWVGGIDDIITLLIQADNDYIEINRNDN